METGGIKGSGRVVIGIRSWDRIVPAPYLSSSRSRIGIFLGCKRLYAL